MKNVDAPRPRKRPKAQRLEMSHLADVSEYSKCYILQALPTSDVQTHSHVHESAQKSLRNICVYSNYWNRFLLYAWNKMRQHGSHAARSKIKIIIHFWFHTDFKCTSICNGMSFLNTQSASPINYTFVANDTNNKRQMHLLKRSYHLRPRHHSIICLRDAAVGFHASGPISKAGALRRHGHF